MEDYILFLDEANVTGANPYFCLAGIIIKRSIYENELIPKINELKIKYFGNTSVLFHYTDMKKNKGEFSVFQDGEKRSNFWNEFNSTLKGIEFITIGTYLKYDDFVHAYNPPSNKHYEVAFTQLINNYIRFLETKKARGNIIFESRQWKENADIQEIFYNILHVGTDMYTTDNCKKYLSTIGFFVKKDNCIGLQVADFVPDSFVRNINGANNFYNVSNNFMRKIFTIGGEGKEIVGLRRLF